MDGIFNAFSRCTYVTLKDKEYEQTPQLLAYLVSLRLKGKHAPNQLLTSNVDRRRFHTNELSMQFSANLLGMISIRLDQAEAGGKPC